MAALQTKTRGPIRRRPLLPHEREHEPHGTRTRRAMENFQRVIQCGCLEALKNG